MRWKNGHVVHVEYNAEPVETCANGMNGGNAWVKRDVCPEIQGIFPVMRPVRLKLRPVMINVNGKIKENVFKVEHVYSPIPKPEHVGYVEHKLEVVKHPVDGANGVPVTSLIMHVLRVK